MKYIILQLNLISKFILFISVLLLPIIINLNFYIFPNWKISSISYLTYYSNFEMVTHNTLSFTMIIGFFIWALTLPYWILNTINVLINRVDNNLNINTIYNNFKNYSMFFNIFSVISIVYAILFFLNYINILQINIPFSSDNIMLGISKSKFFLFLFAILFNMIGIGYCINILLFMLFFMFKIFKG